MKVSPKKGFMPDKRGLVKFPSPSSIGEHSEKSAVSNPEESLHPNLTVLAP